jgi:hypothetical protein
MDKKFWETVGIILVVSNALGIVVLFEMLLFKFPYVSLFFIILYGTWKVNERLFKKKPGTNPRKGYETTSGLRDWHTVSDL